jgi:secreted trypsin-like serine protease
LDNKTFCLLAFSIEANLTLLIESFDFNTDSNSGGSLVSLWNKLSRENLSNEKLSNDISSQEIKTRDVRINIIEYFIFIYKIKSSIILNNYT